MLITKKKYKLVVLIPVGPNTDLGFLSDTLESINFFCTTNTKVVLINDSQRELAFKGLSSEIDEIKNKKRLGKQSGLFYSLSRAILHIYKLYDFDVLLRLDDDGLITGHNPEQDAKIFFKKNPTVGMLGSYKFTFSGEKRDFSWAKMRIRIERNYFWILYNSIRNSKLTSYSKLISKAEQNGYEMGEHVLGGAYFMSSSLIEKLASLDLLQSSEFLGSKLEEDQIFGILTYVAGFKLGDFVTGELPMCLKWRGLPLSPEKIVRLGKKIVHSTRFYEKISENEIRTRFKHFRKAS